MEFNEPDHIYECVPAVLGNDKSPAPCIIGLKVVTVPEIDQGLLEARGLSPEAAEKKTRDLIKSKVAFIRGLKVKGREITDFDDFYKNAPPELVRWVLRAVYSTQLLTEAERKNSQPGSASAST